MRILSSKEIGVAADLLKKSEIVAFPTETVYGLGAVIFDPVAIAKIFRAKNRPSDNPLIAHIAHLDQASSIAHSLPPSFFTLAEHFWPGPLTLLVAKRPEVPDLASAGLPTIGLRMPAHEIALQLIETVGKPLVAPSANLSGKPSSTCLKHVMQDFEGRIAAALDGGACRVGLESTILDLTDADAPQILRPGAITAEEISIIMKCPIRFNSSKGKGSAKPLCPGMKYRHYAPEALVHICLSIKELEEKWAAEHFQRPKMVTSFADLNCPYHPLLPETVYAEMRSADQQGYPHILVLCSDTVQKNQALMNRLLKASE